jgi:hypothetical protein
MDGILVDAMNIPYPRAEGVHKDGIYTIGDPAEAASMSWALASAYFISSPLGICLYPGLSVPRLTVYRR